MSALERSPASNPPTAGADGLTVLVYSDDVTVRERIRLAAGRRPAPDLARVSYLDCSNGAEVVAAVDRGGIDLCVLDGEAWPTGGLGISRQLKNEIRDCPPMLVLIGREVDRWLATWSQADAVVVQPFDAMVLADAMAALLRRRLARRPARR